MTKYGMRKNDMPKVDIREFYEKDGETLPGKKGIMLKYEEWNILKKYIPEIDKALGGDDGQVEDEE